MSHGKPIVTENDHADNIARFGEYYILAAKLYNLFVTCTRAPWLLLRYFEIEDRTLLTESEKLVPDASATPYFLSWAQLMHRNEVPLERVYVLFYSIICQITIPHLSFQDLFILKARQRSAAEANLTPSEYGSKELYEGFQKLTTFFVSEYQKLF